MNTIDDRIQNIKSLNIGATNKRILLVEGVDDIDAYRIFLDKSHPNWENNWAIADAGNKRSVLKILNKEATWIGVIDRDESTTAQITDRLNNYANLFILPRFCLESYLIEPQELWESLPPTQRTKLNNDFSKLQLEILGHKDLWVRHAALWHVINPLWDQLTTLGFNNGILDPNDVPNDAQLRDKLNSWHYALKPDDVIYKFDIKLNELRSVNDTELFSKWIYAKKFYPHVIHQILDRLLGQKPAKERRLAILRAKPSSPADLNPLWQKMGF